MSPDDTRHLDSFLKLTDAARLGEGDLIAGANTLDQGQPRPSGLPTGEPFAVADRICRGHHHFGVSRRPPRPSRRLRLTKDTSAIRFATGEPLAVAGTDHSHR